MSPEQELDLLTTAQVAKIFQVSSETIRDWINAGKLPGVKVGGTWRVRRSDLVEFTRTRYQLESA